MSLDPYSHVYVSELLDCTDYFNFQLATLPKPVLFDKMTKYLQNGYIRLLKRLSHYDQTHLYRPIRPLPSGWEFYLPYIKEKYPLGERHYVTRSSDCDYLYLYRWVTGVCLNCGHSKILWGKGDKHIIYYCRHCHTETPFIRGHWANI